MRAKSKTVKKVEAELRVLIDLDVKQAKDLHYQLNTLLKEQEDTLFLDEVRELKKSLIVVLDERQLF